jgi:hypothetical protein
MKSKTKRILFEAAAALLAIIGAFSLVFGVMLPILNPGFGELHGGNPPFFSIGNLVVLGIVLLMFFSSFICNRKARKFKQLERKESSATMR